MLKTGVINVAHSGLEGGDRGFQLESFSLCPQLLPPQRCSEYFFLTFYWHLFLTLKIYLSERACGWKSLKSTGCLNMNCQTSNLLLGIKNTLLSHKNNICTFMRCGNLTYDTCIWLKITSFCSEISFFSKHQNKVILTIALLISRS